MCTRTPRIQSTPEIVERDDPSVRNAALRRLTLASQAGGRLSTQKIGQSTDNRIKLG